MISCAMRRKFVWAMPILVFALSADANASGIYASQVGSSIMGMGVNESSGVDTAAQQTKPSKKAEEIDLIVVEKQTSTNAHISVDSKDDFVERLHSAGYSRVRSIKQEKTSWSANALNSRGVLVRVMLQKDSGAISETVVVTKK